MNISAKHRGIAVHVELKSEEQFEVVITGWSYRGKTARVCVVNTEFPYSDGWRNGVIYQAVVMKKDGTPGQQSTTIDVKWLDVPENIRTAILAAAAEVNTPISLEIPHNDG